MVSIRDENVLERFYIHDKNVEWKAKCIKENMKENIYLCESTHILVIFPSFSLT